MLPINNIEDRCVAYAYFICIRVYMLKYVEGINVDIVRVISIGSMNEQVFELKFTGIIKNVSICAFLYKTQWK